MESRPTKLKEEIEAQIWGWMDDFLTKPNPFYNDEFAPCPYARAAIVKKTVIVDVWENGSKEEFLSSGVQRILSDPKLTTIVMVFPPKFQQKWGFAEYIEDLNVSLVPQNVLLNIGLTKTIQSQYPNDKSGPYFMVVANSLDSVLNGSKSLLKSNYYDNWPAEQLELVVSRRTKLAKNLAGK